MCIRLLIGSLLGLLGCSMPALAQDYPIDVTIVAPKVEVRSGPSAKFYATGELRQGEHVIVVRECKDQPGWLEIKPPPGSFTWVNAKNVKLVNNGTVAVMNGESADTIPALVGSAVVTGKPDAQTKAGFNRGSVIPVVGRQLNADGETWIPVQPDSREVRYLPAEAVRAGTPVTPTVPTNWALGSKAATPPTTVIPGHPGGAAADLKPVGGNTTAYSPTAAPSTATIPGPPSTIPQWSSYGILRATAALTREGQPMYVLVDARGQTLWYVTTRTGTSLRSYLNRTISVYGTLVNRTDETVTVPYILASHVAVP